MICWCVSWPNLRTPLLVVVAVAVQLAHRLPPRRQQTKPLRITTFADDSASVERTLMRADPSVLGQWMRPNFESATNHHRGTAILCL